MTAKSLDTLINDALAQHHYLTAPKLLEVLEAAGHTYNKTSIYRALEKLLEEGLVCRMSFGTNEIVYELRAAHHDHLVCTHCGRVMTTQCELKLPQEFDGFIADHHHVTVYGICRECQGDE